MGPPALPGEPHTSAEWRRLDRRILWVDLVWFLLSLVPTAIAWLVLRVDISAGSFGIWPALVATTLGVSGSLGDVMRWLKTRYRITEERIEVRTGWISQRYRYVLRDRVRSVHSTAQLRHRLAGLRIVHVGSGESQPAVRLDALDRETAAQLRRRLLTTSPAAELPREDVIARFRWQWFWYNVINFWAFLVAGIILWFTFWLLQIVGVDLRDILGNAMSTLDLGPWATAAVAGGGAFALGTVGLATFFVLGNWRFELLRSTTSTGSALVTRQGLLRLREVHRDDSRLRGMLLGEPLPWRWMGLTEAEVVSTGLSFWSGGEPAASLLPRMGRREAGTVAACVLPGPVRPFEAPLRRHPARALHRRLIGSTLRLFAVVAVTVVLVGTGALPWWAWLVPVAMLTILPLAATASYRALGHGVAGDYLVMRWGLMHRSTVALQQRAVIGVTLRQSVLQRALGLTTVGVSTAAGSGHYSTSDLGVNQAMEFMHEIAPELIDEISEGRACVPKGDNQPA